MVVGGRPVDGWAGRRGRLVHFQLEGCFVLTCAQCLTRHLVTGKEPDYAVQQKAG